MEVPALFYFSCCSLMSIVSLKLGFIAVERENSQISPLIIFLLKRLLAVYVCHSSSCALVHRSGANTTSLFHHFKLSILGFSFLCYVFFSSGPLSLSFVLCYAFVVITIFSLLVGTVDAGLCLDFIVRSFTFSLEVQNDVFYPIFVLLAAFFTAGVAAIYAEISSDQNRFDRETRPVPSRQTHSKKRKIMEFTALTLASIVFQVLVKLESLSHVVAFLWFAVACLGCIALTMDQFELGLFDLLLTNVLIGCTNRFGLSGPTLLATGVSIVLFTLHLELKKVCFVCARDVVLLW